MILATSLVRSGTLVMEGSLLLNTILASPMAAAIICWVVRKDLRKLDWRSGQLRALWSVKND